MTHGYDEWQGGESNMLISRALVGRLTNTSQAIFRYNVTGAASYLASHGISTIPGRRHSILELQGRSWQLKPTTVNAVQVPHSLRTHQSKYKSVSQLSLKVNPFIANLYCSLVFFSWKSRNKVVHDGQELGLGFIASNAINLASISLKFNLFSDHWGVNQLLQLNSHSWHPLHPNGLKSTLMQLYCDLMRQRKRMLNEVPRQSSPQRPCFATVECKPNPPLSTVINKNFLPLAIEQVGPTKGVAITQENSLLDNTARIEGWLARFPMFDWVGGRTSVMSAVGLLPAALQGINIREMLVGASLMDMANRTTVVRNNPAALLALCWYWATDGVGSKDMVVLPYKDSLLLFSRYLQQLVMESLGKEFDLHGNRGKFPYVNIPAVKGDAKKPAVEAVNEKAPKRAFVCTRLSIASAPAPTVQMKICDPKLKPASVNSTGQNIIPEEVPGEYIIEILDASPKLSWKARKLRKSVNEVISSNAAHPRNNKFSTKPSREEFKRPPYYREPRKICPNMGRYPYYGRKQLGKPFDSLYANDYNRSYDKGRPRQWYHETDHSKAHSDVGGHRVVTPKGLHVWVPKGSKYPEAHDGDHDKKIYKGRLKSHV
ncbi:hypothetical protein M5K25_003788 [Dendrobium thyrsiflorum]|uniref:Glucose-6-phosphate isomerase n=1 Tax=Dendrobium thyrsiflorum TaxID=117978 RepID=A0ABD0VL42_DENTH